MRITWIVTADLQAYAAAKQAVYRHAGVQVVNADDPLAASLADATRAQLRFTQQVPGENEYGLVESAGETWLARGTEPLMPVSRIRMVGRHNVMNALAALALGESAGLPLAAMLETLVGVPGTASPDAACCYT